MSDLIIFLEAVVATTVIIASFYLVWCGTLRLAFDCYFGFRPSSPYDEVERNHVEKVVNGRRDAKRRYWQQYWESKRAYKHHEIGIGDLIFKRMLALVTAADCRFAEYLAKRYIGMAFYHSIPATTAAN